MSQILHYTFRITVKRSADGLKQEGREFELPLSGHPAFDTSTAIHDILATMQRAAIRKAKQIV